MNSLVPWSSTGAKRALVCFPWAGAGASVYGQWSTVVGQDIDVFGVRLPGRESRLTEQPVTTMESLGADVAMSVVTDIPADTQIALLGQCFGAFAALGVAAALEQGGREVSLVVLVGQAPPPQPALVDAAWCRAEVARVEREFIAARGDPEMFDLVRPALEADIEIHREFGSKVLAPVAAPVLGVVGRRDDVVTPEAMQGWKAQTSRGYNQLVLDGDHLLSGAAHLCLARTAARALRTLGRA